MDSTLLAQVDLNKEWPVAKVTQFSTLGGFVTSFLPKLLVFAGIIFFILTVIAGFGVIAGAGSQDPHTQERAKGFFTNAIIGLAIIFTSYWVVQIISFVTYGSLKGVF